MIKLVQIIVLFSFMHSCNEGTKPLNQKYPSSFSKQDRSGSPTLINNKDTLNYYISKALVDGDEGALAHIGSHYSLNNMSNQLYIFALIYSNKYKSPFSYYLLSKCLEDNNFIKDIKTENQRRYYLLKAYEGDSMKYRIEVTQVYKDKIPSSQELFELAF